MLAVVAASALVVGIGTGAALHAVTSTTAERWETLAAKRAAVELFDAPRWTASHG